MGIATPNPHYRCPFRCELPEGPITIETPNVLSPESVAEFEEFLSIIVLAMKRRASAYDVNPGASIG